MLAFGHIRMHVRTCAISLNIAESVRAHAYAGMWSTIACTYARVCACAHACVRICVHMLGICMHMLASARAYADAWVFTRVRARMRAYSFIRVCACSCICMHIHAYEHECPHTSADALVCAHKHPCAHAHAKTCVRLCEHARARRHVHAFARTRAVNARICVLMARVRLHMRCGA